MTDRKYYDLILKYASDILDSDRVKSQKNYMQHGNVSTYDHTILVALYSIRIARRFRIKVDDKSLIRGCLLHDYCLYDWHVKDKSHRLHGFHHAKTALINAKRDFELNKIEENMIYTHMFPVNLRLPKYKESVILCIADKVSAVYETFKYRKDK